MSQQGTAAPTGKVMYRVEKFLPPECPNCRQRFEREGRDWVRFFGDIVEGRKVVRATEGYHIIVCEHCRNSTAAVALEEYFLTDRARAEALLREGFVNLMEVQAFGNMARDHHVIHRPMPGSSVVGLDPEV